MNKKINQLLEECTIGLAGDQELRLDIQSELKSHIEERIEEEKHEGADEEKSLENALKAFGEVPDIADGIMQANKKRLNLRGKIRLAAMYLLIPFSIIVALLSLDFAIFSSTKHISGFSGGSYSHKTNPLVKLLYNIYNISGNGFLTTFTKKIYTDNEKLILAGALFEESDLEGTDLKKPKAILDKFPKNKVYMGHYITALIQSNSAKPGKGEEYLNELRKAEKLDSENARYNYALAAYFCDAGCDFEYNHKTKKDDFTIKDRKLFDKGMAELKKGFSKPYYKTYSKEMLKERLKIIGQVKSLGQNIKQIAISANVSLPDLSQLRRLARLAPRYAGILINENQKKEALPFLDAWKRLGTQINYNSFCLVETYVASAIFEENKEMITELYEKAGYPEMAKQYKKEQALLAEPVVKWKERRKCESDNEKLFERSASFMAAMLLYGLGEKISSDELAPGRTLEYITIEMLILPAICFFLILLMCFCLIITLRWHFTANCEKQSMLLLPGLTKTANIFLYSVIVPVIAYYILSRLPATGGREFNIVTNLTKCSIQLACLFLALLIIPAEMTIFYVRKRFKELNLPTPKAYSPVKSIIFKIICGALLVIIILPGTLDRSSGPMSLIAWILMAVTCLLMIVNILVRFWKCIFAEKQYSRYYSSVAKTLIPIFAGTIILLVAISKPYVSTQETYLIQNDPLTTINHETGSMTRIEGNLVERLRKEIQKQEKIIEEMH